MSARVQAQNYNFVSPGVNLKKLASEAEMNHLKPS